MLGGAIAAREQRLLALSKSRKAVEGGRKKMGSSVHGRRLDHNDGYLPLPRGNLCEERDTGHQLAYGIPVGRGASPPAGSAVITLRFFNIGAPIGRAGISCAQSRAHVLLIRMLHFSPFRAGRDDRARRRVVSGVPALRSLGGTR